MADQWFYTRDGQQFGPLSAEQLKQMATSRQLVPTDMLWKDGMKDSAPARAVRGLFPAEPAAPKPPPPRRRPGCGDYRPAGRAGVRRHCRRSRSRDDAAAAGRGDGRIASNAGPASGRPQGSGSRQLPHHQAARRGRHGRGLQGHRPRYRRRICRQGAAAGPLCRSPRPRRPEEGGGHRPVADPSESPQDQLSDDVRFHNLHRHGVHRRREPGGVPSPQGRGAQGRRVPQNRSAGADRPRLPA